MKLVAKAAHTNVEVSTESLTAQPASTGTPAFTAYQYFEITATNLPAADVDQVTLQFTVPVSWIQAQGVDMNDVALYHYANGAWTSLATRVVASSASQVTYSAVSPSLSYFAIGAVTAPAAAPTEAEAPTEGEAVKHNHNSNSPDTHPAWWSVLSLQEAE
ncbi:PGF-pre-PGF domain-containing protein, partial [Candidatus Woesearchaeota archaeon]|nr:PGF-pre-PGF domain-containing protein [Candidatus Woesearchaeota archaeon]